LDIDCLIGHWIIKIKLKKKRIGRSIGIGEFSETIRAYLGKELFMNLYTIATDAMLLL
jgi:hypothetical protein